MIFLTVGTQLAFDRLVEAVDVYAADHGVHEAFAQIGPGGYRPTSFPSRPFISPIECRQRMEAADVVIAHAGMGTILGALELGKPVVVMPRRADLGEHRNDHQLATARRLAEFGGVHVVHDREELEEALQRFRLSVEPARISPYASPRLIEAISGFINA